MLSFCSWHGGGKSTQGAPHMTEEVNDILSVSSGNPWQHLVDLVPHRCNCSPDDPASEIKGAPDFGQQLVVSFPDLPDS